MNRLDPGPCQHCGCTCKSAAPKPSSLLKKMAEVALVVAVGTCVVNSLPIKRVAAFLASHLVAEKVERAAEGGRLLKQKAVDAFRNLGR